MEDNRAYPFTINVSFRGPCLFRDKIDNSNSVETYFTSGEVFTANPKNGIRLWISNSNVVKISLIADTQTFDFDIGASGQVLVEDIKWIKDVDGKYKLTVSVSFTSPSSAGQFVLGGSINGWVEWKDKDGKTLDEIYRK